MLRNVLSVIIGVVTGFVVFSSIQLINYFIVPLPEGHDRFASIPKKEIVDNMPFYGWLISIISYLVGSVAAGFVSGKLAESKTTIFPVFIAIFFILAWIVNIMSLPHPHWIGVFVILIFLPCTLLGHKLAIMWWESA